MPEDAKAEATVETKPDTSVSEAEAIMQFDPFGPPEPADGGQDETGEKPVEGESSGKGDELSGKEKPEKKEPDPKAAVVDTEPPKQQGPTKREQELEQQVASLQQLIQRSAQPQQPQKAEPQKAEPKYQLGLPPQVISGLRSDDEEEFATAMHAVVNGIANRLWTDFQEYFSKEALPQVDHRIQAITQHGTEVRRVHDDFYGTYPHLKNPMVMPVVQRAAMQVAQNWHLQGKQIQWSKEFADDVAALVHQVVPQPQAQPQPQQQPVKKTFTSSPGSRPAVAAENDFASVL